jgi:hypothetical protein
MKHQFFLFIKLYKNVFQWCDNGQCVDDSSPEDVTDSSKHIWVFEMIFTNEKIGKMSENPNFSASENTTKPVDQIFLQFSAYVRTINVNKHT